jgi:dihydrofolate reductase
MKLSLIVAAGEDNGIGKDGQLMWRIQNDMRFFKNTTWAFPVIMGRKTYDEMGKALDGRSNIVITRNTDWKVSDALTVGSLQQAIEEARKLHTKEVFIVGGAQIYAQAIPFADRIYMTRVHANFPEADVHFPDTVQWNEWTLVKEQRFEADEKNQYAHTIQVWDRNNNA